MLVKKDPIRGEEIMIKIMRLYNNRGQQADVLLYSIPLYGQAYEAKLIACIWPYMVAKGKEQREGTDGWKF